MRDAALVRRADRIGERDAEREHAIERHAVRGNQVAERLSVDQLQREDRDAVDVLDRVDRDDVGMVERGGGARLAFEALLAVGIPGQCAGEDFERDLPSELAVRGEVDLAHPAFAQFPFDAVVSELRSDHVCGDYRGVLTSIPNLQLPTSNAFRALASLVVGGWALTHSRPQGASPAACVPDHHQRHRRRLHDFEDRYERLLRLGRSAAPPGSGIAGACGPPPRPPRPWGASSSSGAGAGRGRRARTRDPRVHAVPVDDAVGRLGLEQVDGDAALDLRRADDVAAGGEDALERFDLADLHRRRRGVVVLRRMSHVGDRVAGHVELRRPRQLLDGDVVLAQERDRLGGFARQHVRVRPRTLERGDGLLHQLRALHLDDLAGVALALSDQVVDRLVFGLVADGERHAVARLLTFRDRLPPRAHDGLLQRLAIGA